MSSTPRRELVARSVRQQLGRIGRTPEWLAEQTGIAMDALTPRLAGDAPFDVDQLQAVSVALGITINELIGNA